MATVYGQDTEMSDTGSEVTSRYIRPSMSFDDDGNVISIEETYNGRPIFRKTCPSDIEKRICRLIQSFPHPNVVEVFHVCDEYIDMELLDVDYVINRQDLERAHSYFLKHNIVYLEWEPDNCGTDHNGVTKVFDFGGAGISDANQWLIFPRHGYALRKASDADLYNPRDVDAFAFKEVERIANT
jgi:hypothetical protein